MSLEDTLTGWTGPSSDTEQEKQERTERMICDAITEHEPLVNCGLRVYAKGSYANNTNVRADSDVDIAVECTEAEYWAEATPGLHISTRPYRGTWTPERLRRELTAALSRKFPNAVDTSGSTALRIHSSSTRVDADVVPCFSYRYYLDRTLSRVGTKIFRSDGTTLVNYPEQQLVNGRYKNQSTGRAFKKAVRILKRLENVMVQEGGAPVASFFIECLAYNCPDGVFLEPTWTQTIRNALAHIWNSLQGDEPSSEEQRWLEVNECFFLFHGDQKWTRADGRLFAQAAWNYLGLR